MLYEVKTDIPQFVHCKDYSLFTFALHKVLISSAV